jgi:hypothetical protein
LSVNPAHWRNTASQLVGPAAGFALRHAEHCAAVPATQGPLQYFTVQSNRATMQAWQLCDSVGVLPDRQDVMHASLCPMQLVPQLVACDLAVPFIASAQSEQLSHPPPVAQRYSVLVVTAGRAGLQVTLDAGDALPSIGAWLVLPLDPLLPPELDELPLPEVEPLLPLGLLPELAPLLLPPGLLLPELEPPPSSPADWY